MRSICWWCSSGRAACSDRSDGYELCPAPPPRSDRRRVPGGDRSIGAAVRERRLRPEHHGSDADVCGAVAELEHPQWLLRANLARACALFRARRLHHRASLHQIRRAAVVRHARRDRKSTRLNSSHVEISYAVFCLKKKKKNQNHVFIQKKKKQQKKY